MSLRWSNKEPASSFLCSELISHSHTKNGVPPTTFGANVPPVVKLGTGVLLTMFGADIPPLRHIFGPWLYVTCASPVNMCVCMYVCMYVSCICTCIRMHVMHVCLCVCMCGYPSPSPHLRSLALRYLCLPCEHVCVCMYVCVLYMHMY